MHLDDLLQQGREIWGHDTLTLHEIIIRLCVVQGDLSRLERDRSENKPLNETELQKELGNVIFSMIRWCNDLGYDPKECINLAIQAQIAYQKRQENHKS